MKQKRAYASTSCSKQRGGVSSLRVTAPPTSAWNPASPSKKTYFKAYVTSDRIRHIIDSRHFTELATNPTFSTSDFGAVPEQYHALIPE